MLLQKVLVKKLLPPKFQKLLHIKKFHQYRLKLTPKRVREARGVKAYLHQNKRTPNNKGQGGVLGQSKNNSLKRLRNLRKHLKRKH